MSKGNGYDVADRDKVKAMMVKLGASISGTDQAFEEFVDQLSAEFAALNENGHLFDVRGNQITTPFEYITTVVRDEGDLKVYPRTEFKARVEQERLLIKFGQGGFNMTVAGQEAEKYCSDKFTEFYLEERVQLRS